MNGYFVNNIDINIITQTPKIQKYKKKMRENISKLCEINKNQVNIKGKTTEKLGVIGKEKAIACEVITSVIKYDKIDLYLHSDTVNEKQMKQICMIICLVSPASQKVFFTGRKLTHPRKNTFSKPFRNKHV